jgi:ribosomal protein S18 acetylase RimI-like enzyme
LQLQVNKHNKALYFYQKLGFRVIEEVVFDIGHGYIMDDYLMELVLVH